MHQIYQTEGIVLKSFDFSEADKYLLILTRDFGLIKTAAKGLRKVSSKLRYSLQEFSVSQVSLVQGRSIWRLTNASCESNLFFDLGKNKDKLIVVRSVLDLLTQLLSGQEKNEDLYILVKEAFSFLGQNDFSTKELSGFESLLVLRILYRLGYLDENRKVKEGLPYSVFLECNEWDFRLLDKIEENKRKIIFDINISLQSSQLI
jgi:DNA repair protein RecO (recombination protein O)